MKPVYEALNLREGGLIAVYLTDRGIPAEVRGGHHHSLRGELYNIKGMFPQIFVMDDRDEDRAMALIQEYVEMLKKAPEGEPWVCPSCGEFLEPQFLSCWKCETEKPA
jgi:hypothetical protein